MEQHISEVLGEIKEKLERIEKRIDSGPILPDHVYGYDRAADVLKNFGSGIPLKPGTIRNKVNAGAMPYVEKAGQNTKFSVSDLLKWDAAGRPNLSKFREP